MVDTDNKGRTTYDTTPQLHVWHKLPTGELINNYNTCWSSTKKGHVNNLLQHDPITFNIALS